jgi:valyl-tRNA synthetase
MEFKLTRRQSHALLIEVLDEALRLLPPTIPSFTKLKMYEPLINMQQIKRISANGLKTRRIKC